jgi:thioesterase domain-containing protein
VTVRELLARLQAVDIRLSANGDRVRCSAPVGALTPDLRAEIERMKPEILAFLRSSDTAVTRVSAAVPMRATGSKPPLFLVPGHNGDVFCFLPMLRHLSSDQPVFALEPPGLDSGQTPIETIPQLAAHLADVILATRETGPYLLAGYCMGGVTAFEIAALLRARGHEVPICALFGTDCPTVYWKRYFPVTISLLAAREIRRRLAGRSAAEIVRLVAAKLFGKRPPPAAPPPRNESTERSLRLQAITAAAVRRHRPPRYDGRVALFLANAIGDSNLGRPQRDWARFAVHGLEIVTGPQDCRSDAMLLEPHIAHFGPLFDRRLDAIAAEFRTELKRSRGTLDTRESRVPSDIPCRCS